MWNDVQGLCLKRTLRFLYVLLSHFWRSQHYFLYAKDFRSTSVWKRAMRAAFVRLQDLLGYRRSTWEI